MQKMSWKVFLGLGLIFLSVTVYFIHYLIFRDFHHISIYFVGDVGFVFIEVFLVTLIIHKVLDDKEKKTRLKKLNMIIGSFYSEVGIDLIGFLSEFNPNTDDICDQLQVDEMWSDKRFDKAQRTIKHYKAKISCVGCNIDELKKFLTQKKNFLLQLLQNPALLEHEDFSDLMWSIFHLAEELYHRENIKNLPQSDYEHLARDVERVYALLISQWLNYMKHLRDEYPYLFSLAIRTNPFTLHCEEDEV